MDIVPDTAGASMLTQLGTVFADNSVGLFGILFAAVAVGVIFKVLRKWVKPRV